MEKDIETFVGQKLEVFVSSLEPLLMTAEDALSVSVRTRLCSIEGGNRIRESMQSGWLRG